MDSESKSARGEDSFSGYETPGQGEIQTSTSDAVSNPTQSAEERLEAPKPVIERIAAQPGEANPALVETIGAGSGQVSTAEMLRARETAEEQQLREGHAHIGQDQMAGARPEEFQDRDEGRPNWPMDRQESPLGYMDAPRANAPLGSGAPDTFDLPIKGRVDAAMDRVGTQGSAQESRSGLAPVGHNAAEDKYEQREFERPTPPSEIEEIAPGMVNLPDDES